MKRLFIIIAWMLTVWSVSAADISGIANAFTSGNLVSLQSMMAPEIDFALSGENISYSAKDATAKLSQFFSANKPSAFQVLHHAAKTDSGFVVAKLSAGGKQYRVNVTYSVENNKAIINSIRIE